MTTFGFHEVTFFSYGQGEVMSCLFNQKVRNSRYMTELCAAKLNEIQYFLRYYKTIKYFKRSLLLNLHICHHIVQKHLKQYMKSM